MTSVPVTLPLVERILEETVERIRLAQHLAPQVNLAIDTYAEPPSVAPLTEVDG